jgi:hypothetical protein
MGQAFLPPCLGFHGDYSPNALAALLKATRPELFPDKVRAGPGVPPSTFICFLNSSYNTRLLNCVVTAYNTHQLTTLSSCCTRTSLWWLFVRPQKLRQSRWKFHDKSLDICVREMACPSISSQVLYVEGTKVRNFKLLMREIFVQYRQWLQELWRSDIESKLAKTKRSNI